MKFWINAVKLDTSLMDAYESSRKEWYDMWGMYKERKYLENAAHQEQLRLAQVAKIKEIVFNHALTVKAI